ncbi:MAG: Gfo/Idh/MocA family protein [Janthinobacterium lividum]
MKQTITIGIIGTGGIANGKHMPSLSKLEGVEMVAFCDVEETKAQTAAAKYGTADAKVYTDYTKLLQDPKIDVIHVLTPNDSHAEIAIAALEAGKHVMCEKPMAKKAEDARRMLAVAKASGKKLTIGYQTRHTAESQYLKKLCLAGELGEVYYARALAIRRRAVPTWGVFLDGEKQGGGPLIDIATHSLDLSLWMMDNYKPKSVMGSVYHKLSSTENAANAWGSWDPAKFTVEDSAFGFVTMENGATISVEGAWAINLVETAEAQCILAGTKAGADFKGGLRINGEKLSSLYLNNIQLGASGVAFYEGKSNDAALEEARAWIDAIRNDTPPVVLPEQALVVSEILEAIYKSAATGQAVYFDK